MLSTQKERIEKHPKKKARLRNLEVIECIEGHYEPEKVPFGRVYRWCTSSQSPILPRGLAVFLRQQRELQKRRRQTHNPESCNPFLKITVLIVLTVLTTSERRF